MEGSPITGSALEGPYQQENGSFENLLFYTICGLKSFEHALGVTSSPSQFSIHSLLMLITPTHTVRRIIWYHTGLSRAQNHVIKSDNLGLSLAATFAHLQLS